MGEKGIRNKTRQLVLWLLVFAFITATIFTNNITAQAAGKPSIVLNAKEATLIIGKSKSLKVKSINGLKSKAVTWKSSNAKVAKVSTKGKVTAVKEGTVKITATSKSNKKVMPENEASDEIYYIPIKLLDVDNEFNFDDIP